MSAARVLSITRIPDVSYITYVAGQYKDVIADMCDSPNRTIIADCLGAIRSL